MSHWLYVYIYIYIYTHISISPLKEPIIMGHWLSRYLIERGSKFRNLAILILGSKHTDNANFGGRKYVMNKACQP